MNLVKLAGSLFIGSHFALHWLRILKVVPYGSKSDSLLTYFVIGAALLMVLDALGQSMSRENARQAYQQMMAKKAALPDED